MKKYLYTAIIFMFATSLFAEHPSASLESQNLKQEKVEADLLKNVSFNLLIEDRIFSNRESQTLLKLQADTMLTEKLSLWGGVWLRDTVPVYHDENNIIIDNASKYINYIDIFAGLSYSLHRYFSPYMFIEEFIDRSHDSTVTGSFVSIGFSGTLYDEGKHNLSYFTEQYYTLNTYELDNWRLWGTETAMKYRYSIYEQTSLYIQAVWNTDSDEEGYGVHGYADGIYSTRLGIQVDF